MNFTFGDYLYLWIDAEDGKGYDGYVVERIVVHRRLYKSEIVTFDDIKQVFTYRQWSDKNYMRLWIVDFIESQQLANHYQND